MEEELLRALDQELRRTPGPAHQSRSSALSDALELWLKQRRVQALQEAYAQLGQLQGGDATAAAASAAAMGADSLDRLDG